MAVLSIVERETDKTDEREKMIDSLLESIRNQQLDFFEEAEAIQSLIEYCGFTQEETAVKLGRVQSTIANKLRLLRLTPAERETITQFGLTERHARALLRIASPEDRIIMLDRIVDEGLRVDKAERLINEFIGSNKRLPRHRKRPNFSRRTAVFESNLNKAVDLLKSVGIAVELSEIRGEDYIEYTIRIPRK